MVSFVESIRGDFVIGAVIICSYSTDTQLNSSTEPRVEATNRDAFPGKPRNRLGVAVSVDFAVAVITSGGVTVFDFVGVPVLNAEVEREHVGEDVTGFVDTCDES